MAIYTHTHLNTSFMQLYSRFPYNVNIYTRMIDCFKFRHFRVLDLNLKYT